LLHAATFTALSNQLQFNSPIGILFIRFSRIMDQHNNTVDVSGDDNTGTERGQSVASTGSAQAGGGNNHNGPAVVSSQGSHGSRRFRSRVGPSDFTVAKTTNFKSLAAKLAGEARKGMIPSLRAMGANNINTVVKGFSLARRYIEDQGIDLNCHVNFIEVPIRGRDGVDGSEHAELRTAMRFSFDRTVLRSQEHRRDDMEFKVSATSSTKSVAGAIAKNVREFYQIALLAVGPSSVNQCIKSIAIACRYCDENNLSVSFRPRFTTIAHDNSESISGLRFTLYISQI
jgi:stage V sporulation protein SpoVS